MDVAMLESANTFSKGPINVGVHGILFLNVVGVTATFNSLDAALCLFYPGNAKKPCVLSPW
jgi:hypothetical protein